MVHSAIVPRNSVDSLRNILHNKVKVNFILIGCRIEAMLHLNNVRMIKHAQDLELPILVPLVL